MAMKRYAEYRHIGDPRVAAAYRRSFAYYTEERLLVSLVLLRDGVRAVRRHLHRPLPPGADPVRAARPPACSRTTCTSACSRTARCRIPRSSTGSAASSPTWSCATVVFVLLMFTSIPALYDLFNVEPANIAAALDARRPVTMVRRSISFIIPVRDDAARLERCLRTIRAATPTAPTSRSSSPTTARPTTRPTWRERRGATVLDAARRARSASCATRGRGAATRRRSSPSSTPITRSARSGSRRAIDALADPAVAAAGAPYHRAHAGHLGAALLRSAARRHDRTRGRSTGWAAATWPCAARRSTRSAASTRPSRRARTSTSAASFGPPAYGSSPTTRCAACITAIRGRSAASSRRAVARPRQPPRQPSRRRGRWRTLPSAAMPVVNLAGARTLARRGLVAAAALGWRIAGAGRR